MREKRWALTLGMAALLALSACSQQSTGGAISRLRTEFKAAAPALKDQAELAASACETNGYVAAVTALQALTLAPELVPQQREAVDKMKELIMAQLYREADQGDTNALNARDELQRLRQRPR
jgi:hypothetical protein